MRKLITALGTAGLLVVLAVPVSAAPNDAIIPSVDVFQPGAQGAEHACDGLAKATRNPHQQSQLSRHGCTTFPLPPGGVLQ